MAEKVIGIIFQLGGGHEMAVAHSGARQNVMELARRHDVPGLDGACGGLMACATCHVHVAPEWLAAVGEASCSEREILEFTADPRPESRLGCQIWVTPDLDGLRLRVAAR